MQLNIFILHWKQNKKDIYQFISENKLLYCWNRYKIKGKTNLNRWIKKLKFRKGIGNNRKLRLLRIKLYLLMIRVFTHQHRLINFILIILIRFVLVRLNHKDNWGDYSRMLSRLFRLIIFIFWLTFKKSSNMSILWHFCWLV